MIYGVMTKFLRKKGQRFVMPMGKPLDETWHVSGVTNHHRVPFCGLKGI